MVGINLSSIDNKVKLNWLYKQRHQLALLAAADALYSVSLKRYRTHPKRKSDSCSGTDIPNHNP